MSGWQPAQGARKLGRAVRLKLADIGAGARLLARITHRSVLALGIAPGRALFAQVKGVALLD